MAGIKSTEKDKKRNENGASTQHQNQQQQQQQEAIERDFARRARPLLTFPSLAPFLANPSLASAMMRPSEQGPNHNQDLQRLIDSYTGGDMGYLIEWFEQVNEDLDKIRRELDVVQKRLRDNDGSA